MRISEFSGISGFVLIIPGLILQDTCAKPEGAIYSAIHSFKETLASRDDCVSSNTSLRLGRVDII